AGFIGEPPMNLLSSLIVQRGEDFIFTFESSNLEVSVPKRYQKVVKDQMKITLGVRPVDIRIATEKTLGTYVPIAIYENLGDERRISVRVGEALLSMTTAEDVYYNSGEEVQLVFHEERTHLFAPDTGERIRG
ncbi:MAG: ABC transporter ATP-binding protein, partial [Lachnospiraceae bacterium]